MATMRITEAWTIGGVSFRRVLDVESDNLAESNPDVTAAKVGTLSARVDNDTGTFTGVGHGVLAGDRVDAYWSEAGVEKYRANMTAGVIAGNDVPLDGGSGDNLPIATTAMTIKVRHVENLGVTGDDVQGIVISCDVPAIVTFLESDGTTLVGTPIYLTADDATPPNYTYTWRLGGGVTNPVAGGAVAKVGLSHGESDASHSPYVGVLHN
jgi:hypothetical protein